MLPRSSVVAGWRSSTNVAAVISDHSEIFEQIGHVIISCVDSDWNVRCMPWARRFLDVAAPGWATGAGPLILSGCALVSVQRSGNVFCGFDEIWIPTEFPVAFPLDHPSLVSPENLDESGITQSLVQFVTPVMRLGLGDGIGLNFVATDLELATRVGLA